MPIWYVNPYGESGPDGTINNAKKGTPTLRGISGEEKVLRFQGAFLP